MIQGDVVGGPGWGFLKTNLKTSQIGIIHKLIILYSRGLIYFGTAKFEDGANWTSYLQ